jgi:group I intron endonuclease
MTIGIYKITNIVSGEYYIGSSIYIQRRFSQHKNYLTKNKHNNTHLQRAWNCYGSQNFIFEVIDTLPHSKIDRLLSLEQFYLDSIADWKKVYNKAKLARYSNLNLKQKDSKHYYYDKDRCRYVVRYKFDGIATHLGRFKQTSYVP